MSSKRRPQLDGLGHVAFDLDLSRHEGLHAGLLVAVDEDRHGHREGDGELGGSVVEQALLAGSYGFKLADSNWATLNIGAATGAGSVSVGGFVAVVAGENPGNR